MQADVSKAIDGDNLAVLSLLDLSAAFDKADHDTSVLKRRHYDHGGSRDLHWLRVPGRISFVRCFCEACWRSD